MTIFLSPYITRLARGLGLIDLCSGMQQVRGMHPLEITTLQAMRMIERRDTPHGVQFQMVHGSDSKSSDDEGSLPETTTSADHLPTIVLAIIAFLLFLLLLQLLHRLYP